MSRELQEHRIRSSLFSGLGKLRGRFNPGIKANDRIGKYSWENEQHENILDI
jgi:hypothetical protein